MNPKHVTVNLYMDRYDYLILGGGIAGVTAAETIRENDHVSTIGIISDEPHVFYSRVMLPAYLKKRIPREKLFLRHIDDFTRKGIELRLGEEAIYLDVNRREVGLRNQITVGYGKLLLASGGRAKQWGEKGDQDLIYRLQTLNDADRLYEKIDSLRRPLVIGASFISLEFLEIFVSRGIIPSLLVRDGHFFGKVLDQQGGEILRDNFEKYDIATQFNDAVEFLTKKEDKIEVTTKALRKLECDALAVGIGIDRNIEFLRGSGVELSNEGVRVDQFLETSQKGIFAGGDAADFYDVILEKNRVVGNWGNAFLQGKSAGLNMIGQRSRFRHVSSYSITNLELQITVLGDYSGEEGTETVIRADTLRKEYERFFIRHGRLVGAALINRFKDKAHLAKIIESQTSMEEYRDRLSDLEFDIHEIEVIN